MRGEKKVEIGLKKMSGMLELRGQAAAHAWNGYFSNLSGVSEYERKAADRVSAPDVVHMTVLVDGPSTWFLMGSTVEPSAVEAVAAGRSALAVVAAGPQKTRGTHQARVLLHMHARNIIQGRGRGHCSKLIEQLQASMPANGTISLDSAPCSNWVSASVLLRAGFRGTNELCSTDLPLPGQSHRGSSRIQFTWFAKDTREDLLPFLIKVEGAQRSKGSERAVAFADRMASLIADWRADGVGAAATLSPAAFDVGGEAAASVGAAVVLEPYCEAPPVPTQSATDTSATSASVKEARRILAAWSDDGVTDQRLKSLDVLNMTLTDPNVLPAEVTRAFKRLADTVRTVQMLGDGEYKVLSADSFLALCNAKHILLKSKTRVAPAPSPMPSSAHAPAPAPDVSDAPDSDEPKPKRTRTDNHHPVPANKTLPPGWRVEWRDAPARSYRVLLGPAGELCLSYAKAWQVATADAERLD